MPAQPPILIGLTGRAGAGKSTVAHHLEDEWAFEHFALADPILSMVLALFEETGISETWAIARALKEQPVPTLGVSYRRIAQTLGTEWGRQVMGPDFWLRVAAHKLRQARLHEAKVVISDVRFANEAQWVIKQGGVLVRVLRPDLPPLPPDTAAHSSEQHAGALPVRAELLNGASIDALRDRVDDLVRGLVASA